MKKYIVIFIIGIISITVFIPGCTSSTTSETVEILPADRLVKKLEVNRRKIKSFEGKGTLILNTPEIKNSVSFQVTLVKPDSLFLTLYGPFGIELAQIFINKSVYVFYEALNNTAYEGNVNDNVLKTIFRVDLSLSDLTDAFVGSVNMSERLYKEPDKYKVDYNKYILTYIDSLSKSSTVYTIDVRDLGISDYVIKDKSEKLVMEGKYSGFGIIESVAVPYKIELSNSSKRQNLTIEYNSIEVNKKNIYIDFKIPEDADRIKF